VEYKIFLPSVDAATKGQKFIFIPIINGREDREFSLSYSELTPTLTNLVLKSIGKSPKYIRARI
jgi:hypothetical protein